MFAQKDFEIDTVLNKPLMAHLATVDKGEPRDSPVWFIWEESYLWVFGTAEDSFIKRLQQDLSVHMRKQTWIFAHCSPSLLTRNEISSNFL